MAAAKKKTTTAKKSTKATPRRTQQKYYRNVLHIPVSFRLEESDRRIALAARGQRGDVAPVKRGETTDPIFIANKGTLFEVITKEEVDQIVEKQATNIQQQRRHPVWETIRNEKGDAYDNHEVNIASPEEAQGYTIAKLDKDGNVPLERQGQKGVQIKRLALPGSEDNPLPTVPDGVAPEDQANYLAQLRAQTTVEPTQHDE